MTSLNREINQYKEYVDCWSRKFQQSNDKCEYTYDEMMKNRFNGNPSLFNKMYKEREEADLWLFLYNKDFEYLKKLEEKLNKRKAITLKLASAITLIILGIIPKIIM